MNPKQFQAAINVSVEAALKSPNISLPEIIGVLQLAIINADRTCYQHAMAARMSEAHEATNIIVPPKGIQRPR